MISTCSAPSYSYGGGLPRDPIKSGAPDPDMVSSTEDGSGGELQDSRIDMTGQTATQSSKLKDHYSYGGGLPHILSRFFLIIKRKQGCSVCGCAGGGVLGEGREGGLRWRGKGYVVERGGGGGEKVPPLFCKAEKTRKIPDTLSEPNQARRSGSRHGEGPLLTHEWV